MELLRPILELGVVIPGMLLAYFPVKSSLKQPLSKLVLWLAPLLTLLCAAGGVMCYARRMPTAPMLAGLTLLAVVICIKTLRISIWKSGTIALSVCAVFACINSLSRAINAAMLAGLPQAQAAPWFCLRSAICIQIRRSRHLIIPQHIFCPAYIIIYRTINSSIQERIV